MRRGDRIPELAGNISPFLQRVFPVLHVSRAFSVRNIIDFRTDRKTTACFEDRRETTNVSSQFTLARNYVSTSLLGRLMFRAEKTHSKAWDITESAGTRGSSLSHKYTPDLWNLVQAPRAAMHSFNQQASQSSSVSLEGEERKGGLLWKEQIDRASYIDFV
jgi:hypothetical protein